MKKQYINPTTITIMVETQPLMEFGSGNGDTLNGGGSKGNYDSSMGQASRQGGGWDDED